MPSGACRLAGGSYPKSGRRPRVVQLALEGLGSCCVVRGEVHHGGRRQGVSRENTGVVGGICNVKQKSGRPLASRFPLTTRSIRGRVKARQGHGFVIAASSSPQQRWRGRCLSGPGSRPSCPCAPTLDAPPRRSKPWAMSVPLGHGGSPMSLSEPALP